MSKLWMALGISFVGHLIAWFHMQGQFKYEWARSWWWIILGGIPVSICFFYGTRWYFEHFDFKIAEMPIHQFHQFIHNFSCW